MPTPEIIYTIDDVEVNDRIDWRHTPPIAQPTANRLEGFPGVQQHYLIVGPSGIKRFTVSGLLQATTFAGLHAAIDTASALRTDGLVHKVVIQDVTYEGCQLENLVMQGENFPLEDDGQDYQVQLVTYLWRIIGGGEA